MARCWVLKPGMVFLSGYLTKKQITPKESKLIIQPLVYNFRE